MQPDCNDLCMQVTAMRTMERHRSNAAVTVRPPPAPATSSIASPTVKAKTFLPSKLAEMQLQRVRTIELACPSPVLIDAFACRLLLRPFVRIDPHLTPLCVKNAARFRAEIPDAICISYMALKSASTKRESTSSRRADTTMPLTDPCCTAWKNSLACPIECAMWKNVGAVGPDTRDKLKSPVQGRCRCRGVV